MTRKEKFIQERKERLERQSQEFLAKIRGQQSPTQQRLFEKMGTVLKVSKPDKY